MKGQRFIGSGVAAVLVLVLMAGLALAQAPEGTRLGTAFTYQGRLKSSEVPYTGDCDLEFGLWDALENGNQVGTLTKTNVAVDEGFFTVQLDYGAFKFTGDARWLEISVRCPAGSGSYTLLSPRQALTAAPAALSLALPFLAEANIGGPLACFENEGDGEAAVFSSAGGYALWVATAGLDALYVASAGQDGVRVVNAGGRGVAVETSSGDGLFVNTAHGNGVKVNAADFSRMQVDAANGDGVYVGAAGDEGVQVRPANRVRSRLNSGEASIQVTLLAGSGPGCVGGGGGAGRPPVSANTRTCEPVTPYRRPAAMSRV